MTKYKAFFFILSEGETNPYILNQTNIKNKYKQFMKIIKMVIRINTNV